MSNIRYELLNTGAVSHEGPQLLYVTSAQYGPDWQGSMHAHTCTELFYCVRGIGEFRLTDCSRPVGSDDLIIVNSQVEHTETSVSSNPLEYIVLGVGGLDLQLAGEASPCAILNCRQQRNEMLFYLREFVREAENTPQGWETVCQHLLDVFLIKLSRQAALQLASAGTYRANSECAAVRRYIDEHFTESLSLDVLAEVAHVNKYHLAHTFQREYGISPISYLIMRRIRESRHMLENTNYSLSQIARSIGFSSPSYFSQSFHRSEGISPAEYRKRARVAQATAPVQS